MIPQGTSLKKKNTSNMGILPSVTSAALEPHRSEYNRQRSTARVCAVSLQSICIRPLHLLFINYMSETSLPFSESHDPPYGHSTDDLSVQTPLIQGHFISDWTVPKACQRLGSRLFGNVLFGCWRLRLLSFSLCLGLSESYSPG